MKAFLVTLLFVALAILGFRTWWIYFGWYGLVAMVFFVFIGIRIVMRGIDEDWDSFVWYFILAAFGIFLCTKVPRFVAFEIWRESGVQIGGSEWVSDPRYGPPPTLEEQIQRNTQEVMRDTEEMLRKHKKIE